MLQTLKQLGVLGLVTALIMGLALTVLAAPQPEQRMAAAPLERPLNQQTPVTVITVTSTTDPNDSKSETCSSEGLCTLRRALVEAGDLSSGERPVLIAFDLATDDPGYDATNGVWIIQAIDTLENEAFPQLDGGQIILDGTTQVGGRDAAIGPNIVLRGGNTGTKRGLVVNGDNNEIRGLAFQSLREMMLLNNSNNVIEDNWFGLSIDGAAVELRNPEFVSDGSGQSGVFGLSAANNNIIRNNAFLGLTGASVDVQGDQNSVLSNTVGTRRDGTVPDVRPESKCRPNARYNNWFPGAGVDVGGTGNTVANNRIVGMLFSSADPFNSPDNALDVTGFEHVIQENLIGLESDGSVFGVCGRGIVLSGASGAENVQVLTNTIAGHGNEAFFIGGTRFTLDAVTLQGNKVIEPQANILRYGTEVPTGLQSFKPAAVTSISGTSVSGTAGENSPCADCIVELFLDEVDTVTETITTLARVTADGDGNWSATLTRSLALTEGIRTASTTVVDGQIDNGEASGFSAGTTSRFSQIYTQTGAPSPVPPEMPPVSEPLPLPEITYDPAPTAALTYNTIITVTSAGDFEASSDSRRACTISGPGISAASPCTLQRALNEASYLSENVLTSTPILIRFSLPTTDSYDSVAQVWTIQLTETLETNAIDRIDGVGGIILDGENALPGGRDLSNGPHIFIRGPEGNVVNGLVFDGDGNEVRNLGFQNFNQFLTFNGSSNIIEDNWFGLTVDGQDIALRTTGFESDGGGNGGVFIANNTDNNLVRNNTFLGFKGKALNVQGDNSIIRANRIGTRADGTVPAVSASRYCKPNAAYENWFAGAGVNVTGSRNQVGGPAPEDGNRIVGLLFNSADPLNTPDNALSVNGGDHLVQHNIIGVTEDGVDFGTCGRGIVIGSDYTRVVSNTIANAGIEAIGVYGTQVNINSVSMWGNIIRSNRPVAPNVNDQLNSNEAIIFGPLVPESLSIFTPSQVITFTSSEIAGGNGENNDCPFCRLELFLDDLDPVTETLQSLGVITTDINGDWRFPLSEPLPLTTGVRVQNTSLLYGVIENFDAGSSSRLSPVYSQTGAVAIDPPQAAVPTLPTFIPAPPADPMTPTATITYNTIITVTSAGDFESSDAVPNTCTQTGPGISPESPCTLKRALNEASYLAQNVAGSTPILIRFSLPTTDSFDVAAGVWTIQLTETLDLNAIDRIDGVGEITLDGENLLPGGRDLSNGPHIFIRGPEGRVVNGLVIDGDGNEIRNLGFQNFDQHLTLNGSYNIVENNWFGLSIDGQSLSYRNPEFISDGSGTGGIATADNTTNNLIRNNALAGFRSSAISSRGDYASVLGNYVGTRSDGTVPAISENRRCQPNARYDNWFGGTGINMSGRYSLVADNIVAALLLYSNDPESTQDDAIAVTGSGNNVVRNNQIGLDANGQEVGTCYRGIYISSSFSWVLSNTAVNAAAAPIFLGGTQVDVNAINIEHNIVRGDYEAAIDYGNVVPSVLQNFTPTHVIDINGTSVSGGLTDNNPCPFCRVEVFADDLDPYMETLESLAVLTTDVNSAWSLTLSEALPLTRGLRVANTALDYGVIENFEAGSSSRIYDLFVQDGAPAYVPPADPAPALPPMLDLPTYLDPPTAPLTYATVITVTTTDDSNTSGTQTCADVTADACSLRLAINLAGDLSPVERPALIAFDLPTTDPNYDAAGFWVIELNTFSSLSAVDGGQVVIDGSTQPEGRPLSEGPRVFLLRDNASGGDLQIGQTAGDNGNVVRYLGFQNVEISFTGSENIIEYNWLGLSTDGSSIYFRNNDPGSDNHAIINGASSDNNNLIQYNKLAGSRTDAINLQSDDNIVRWNTIGLRADGTVPAIDPAKICDSTDTVDNWFGGGTVYISGNRNQVISNTLGALLIQGSSTSTQDPLIDVINGRDHLVQENRVGLDANGDPVWVCADGISVRAGFTRVLSNTVANANNGIFVNGDIEFINANSMRGNILTNTLSGITFGPAVPTQLVNFDPALVTLIDGVTVTGISSDPCPYCHVDVYLDDDDSDVEALAYLGGTVADANGNWSLTLPAPLGDNEGLRTISTARDYGIVKQFEAETSSSLSILYQVLPPTAPQGVTISGPSIVTATVAANFVAEVSPVTATLPITFLWEADGLDSITNLAGVSNDVDLSFDMPGDKTITVTVTNPVGSQQSTFSLTVLGAPGNDPLTGLEISGPSLGEPNVAYDFTATALPSSAQTPLTFTWQADDQSEAVQISNSTSDVLSYTWASTGTKTITVTVEQATEGQVLSETTTYNVVIDEDTPAPSVAVTGLSLSGPTSGEAGTSYSFAATAAPGDATTPITFTWQASEQGDVSSVSSTVGDSISYTWSTTGTKLLTVTANNGFGSAGAVYSISIEATTPSTPTDVAVTGLSLSGPTSGEAGTSYSFAATAAPGDATTPITFTWQASEQGDVSSVSSTVGDSISYTWSTTGTKLLTVTANNGFGSAGAVYSISIEATTPSTPTDVVTATVTSAGGSASFGSGNQSTTVEVPAGAVTDTIELAFTEQSTVTNGLGSLNFAGRSFTLEALVNGVPQSNFQFNVPVTLTVTYNEADLNGQDENTLILYRWNGSEWQDGAETCTPPSSYQREPAADRLSLPICGLSEWFLGAAADIPPTGSNIFLPLVIR